MRKPIQYNFDDGQLLYAALMASDAIHVSIELPDGSAYGLPWSVPATGLTLGRDEFVAQTWGDHHGRMASAMMGTGWFERTCATVAIPADEINEVWRLSPQGKEWLAAANQISVSVYPGKNAMTTPIQSVV